MQIILFHYIEGETEISGIKKDLSFSNVIFNPRALKPLYLSTIIPSLLGFYFLTRHWFMSGLYKKVDSFVNKYWKIRPGFWWLTSIPFVKIFMFLLPDAWIALSREVPSKGSSVYRLATSELLGKSDKNEHFNICKLP